MEASVTHDDISRNNFSNGLTQQHHHLPVAWQWCAGAGTGCSAQCFRGLRGCCHTPSSEADRRQVWQSKYLQGRCIAESAEKSTHKTLMTTSAICCPSCPPCTSSQRKKIHRRVKSRSVSSTLSAGIRKLV